MNNNKAIHKVLKVLDYYYKIGEENNGFGNIVTDLGRSYSANDLSKKTSLNIAVIRDVCKVLNNGGYITNPIDGDIKFDCRYLITEKGQVALVRKHFLNQIWYRNWKYLLTLVISILGLLVSYLIYLR
ncbi:hypothetical protein [Dysgonomonas sp. ZJ709]|uniref:hypothetical protein n=1 Tax=Dysgonomonas sp. ZJ709 TaxID=2709797 RepID=UPI0013EDD7BA|nr:hypothetical protein [Dysgonomonas sp. ZJ709]